MCNNSLSAASRKAGQGGMGLVESVSALSILSFAALGVVSSMLSTAGVDEAMRERTVALRAATSRMEVILAHDYQNDITDLVAFLQQPDQALFEVEELSPPMLSVLDPAAQAMVPLGQAPPCGRTVVDDSDTQRVRITVTINWTSRTGEARRLRVPTTVSAVIR